MAQAAAALSIKEERTFSAELGGRKVCGLAIQDAWEGFTKYGRADGAHLIVLDSEQRIVKGTPALMSSLGLLDDEHFISIPETTLPDGTVVPAFKCGRYPASKSVDGAVTHSFTAKPWVNIKFADAVAACAAAGLQLARESQELAVRHLICQQPENWTGSAVGEGSVFQGLHRGTVSGAQAADYVSPNADERSYHVLPGGERVYGVAGNIWTLTFDDVQGDASGLVADRMRADSISLTSAPYPSRECGMGYRTTGDEDWSGLALVRGGYWDDGDYAGVFHLGYSNPGYAYDGVGFRCTKPE